MSSTGRGGPQAVIVGGGVIGLCSAYFLRRAGLDVTLLDKGRTGQAASKGNAGWITRALSAPVPAPGVFSYGLRSMLLPDSPLYIKPSAAITMMPWLLRFATYCRTGPYQRGLEAMARLTERALPAYERLRTAGVDVRFDGDGLLFCFMDLTHIPRTLKEIEPMTQHGESRPAVMGGAEIRELEPALSERVVGGFMVPQERFVHPATLTSLLDETIRGMGVNVREGAEVLGFERNGSAVTGVRLAGEVLAADQVLLAAGAWTGELCALLGKRLPIQAGKGYSFAVQLEIMPRHALYMHEARVGASPFGGGLRLAGTMEFSGINVNLDRRRIQAIARSCEPYFAERIPAARAEEWVGMRPLAPDGLPVIGRLEAFANVFVASGHSMLGITLGPATGEVVAGQMLTGQTPSGFEAFSPARFGRVSTRSAGL